jgi:hypothetical protein
MRRWFLSYTSQDFALTQALAAGLKRSDPDAHIFFAPESMRAGSFWQPQLAEELANSTAFVLLVGETGVGPWQVMEYYEALDRRAKESNYPVILILSAKRPAPGLPFARQLHWVLTEDPASEATVGKLIDAASGPATRPRELWRYTRPYRGLEAMTEANSDYFFGRTRETVEIINIIAAAADKLPVLLGNSGVGKSSLAQAGVLASLLRQGFPEHAANAGAWPQAFHDSRRWCFLTLRPGTEPLNALVTEFLRAWQLDPTRTQWVERLDEWVTGLLDGRRKLSELLNATGLHCDRIGQPSPRAFFLYVDQGEELYVRAGVDQRRRFSEILADGLADPRLRALMSLRSNSSATFEEQGPTHTGAPDREGGRAPHQGRRRQPLRSPGRHYGLDRLPAWSACVRTVRPAFWDQVDFTHAALHVRRAKNGTPSTHPRDEGANGDSRYRINPQGCFTGNAFTEPARTAVWAAAKVPAEPSSALCVDEPS